jgi:dihydropteroate synthase
LSGLASSAEGADGVRHIDSTGLLGFGKSVDENFTLLGHLDDVAPPGAPLVVGASRKAFLGSLSDRPPSDRLPESLAAVAIAARVASKRPLLVRVHDVEETIRFLAVLRRG